MKTKFKVGDKVRCIELGNPTEGDHYAKEDGLQVGGVYTVTNIGDNGLGRMQTWIEVDEKLYWHHQDSFRLFADAVVVVLRRKSDEKSVLKVLEEAGYTWHGGQIATDFSPAENGCRTINVWVNIKSIGIASYSGNVYRKPKDIMNRAYCLAIMSDPNYTVFINTKPSVNEAITELKKYI